MAEPEVPKSVPAERRARLRDREAKPEIAWLGICRRLMPSLQQGTVPRK